MTGVTRRDALRLGLGAAATLGLAGCGGRNGPLEGPHADAVARTSIAIDHASYYAPIQDLTRLVQARAHARDVSVLFSTDPAGSAAQVASLKGLTGERGGFRVVVVAPFDAAAVDPIARSAIERGLKIVSYITPLAHQTAAISVDPAAVARLLAEHAVARGGRRDVLLVAPPATSPIPDPFFPYARAAAAATARAAAAAGLRAVATITALGTPDAEQAVRAARAAHPGVDTVLAWNDATALGAARAVPADGYVGGLGAPAITTAAALRALDDDDGGPLRCLVAPRLSALADALVDLPSALLKGSTPPSGSVAPQRFTRGAQATRAALADYA